MSSTGKKSELDWNLFEDVACEDKHDITEDEIDEYDHACNTCGSLQMVVLDGMMCCRKCGVIDKAQILESAEWRYYGAADSKSSNPIRCGMLVNEFLPKSSLGSVIGHSRVGSKNWHAFNRIRKYHQWNAMPYKERSLYNSFTQLQDKAKKAGIPHAIIEEAKKYYKKLSETKISRGTNRNALIASCIYISCKKNKVPRSAKEIAEIYGIKRSEMTKGCKSFLEIMSIGKNTNNYKVKATNALDFIERYCSNLDMGNTNMKMCYAITKRAIDSAIVDDNTPPSIAAGCIFLVSNLCNLDISKNDVSKACNVSEVTISKCYKKLYKYRHYLFPKEIIMQFHIT